ncbi:MAG: DUF86 domain-containing protein [Terriglobia bacterium]
MKPDRVYLLHIRDAIRRILEYTREGKEAFMTRPIVQDAVVRNLEIVGEAVKNLSDSLKVGHPGVPWKRIAGMRDKMIHEYFGVNLELVWEVVQGDLRKFETAVESMLQGEQAG